MTGIFANQFSRSNPYDPVGLDTGTPEVGVTLSKKKPGSPEESKVGARVPTKSTAAASGAIAAGNAMGISNANSASAGLAAQGTRNKLSTMQHAMAIQDTATAPSSNFGGGDFGMPTTHTSGAQVPVHSSGGGFWGSLGHDIASGFDTVRHDVASAGHAIGQTFQEQNSFGEPQFQSKDYHQSVPQNNHNPITGIAQHGQPTNMEQFINRPGGRYTDIPGISAANRGLGTDMPDNFLYDTPQIVKQAAASDSSNMFEHFNPAQFFEQFAREDLQDA